MKKNFLSLGILLGPCLLFSQTTKVLFIGNSYVYTNDLPQMLHDLALSMGDSIYFDSNAPGGYTFQMHSTNATTLSKINAQDWDYVILQAQSQEPSFPPAQVQTDTYPYAAILDSLVHANNPCTKTMFYMTWGRKYGDASNCAFYPPVCTFEGMNQRLRESYLEMGTNNFAQVAPVGVAWKNARMLDSTINLWSADNSHPSVAGTYLTACVFYAAIFKQSPVAAPFMSSLGTGDAYFLQQVAAATVLDSLDTWMLNQVPIHAGIIFNTNLLTTQFSSDCYNATQYSWDFGDGNTSVAMNPSHTYALAGTYAVQLIASNSCYSDTVMMNVTVNGTAGIEGNSTAVLKMYPNPVTDHIMLEAPGILGYILTDVHGKTITEQRVPGTPATLSVSMDHLPAGVYFVQVSTTSGMLTAKILKQ